MCPSNTSFSVHCLKTYYGCAVIHDKYCPSQRFKITNSQRAYKKPLQKVALEINKSLQSSH